MEQGILATESVQTLLHLCDLHTPLQGQETKERSNITEEKSEIICLNFTYCTVCLLLLLVL